MDFNNVLGISEERFDAFDFIIVATTHLHLDGNTDVERLYAEHFDMINRL